MDIEEDLTTHLYLLCSDTLHLMKIVGNMQSSYRLQQILSSISEVLSSVCGTAASTEERINE